MLETSLQRKMVEHIFNCKRLLKKTKKLNSNSILLSVQNFAIIHPIVQMYQLIYLYFAR